MSKIYITIYKCTVPFLNVTFLILQKLNFYFKGKRRCIEINYKHIKQDFSTH